MTIVIAALALIATFYQLYLQRVHNEKSLKLLIQVDLGDLKDNIYVHVTNNGVGPLIIEKLTFTKDGKEYSGIKECLEFDLRSYMYVSQDAVFNKTLLPGGSLEVFGKDFEEGGIKEEMDSVREQLAPITLKVDYRDIYDNKFSFEKSFKWFLRRDI